MTIEEQITRLDRSVEELERCVASLAGTLFLKKLNRWAPRDIVAHLIGWNRHVIEGSRQIRRGELPFYDVDPGEDYSAVNAALLREYPSRDREELLAELKRSAQELKQFLRSLHLSEWNRDYGVTHEGSTITIRNTVDELVEDYAHHRRQIEEWAKCMPRP